ncbi:uncharacterized protein LOC133174029 [Saccostrea echinata]|uniref:uncharacterized protein LOC133174029 n=1 Tax=Saccostrea echinata TaxID=191078 RepID=UPI002A7FC6E7|nr:uncharacterized protein LOC133174029 [Saccostrea echinata]
MGSQTIEDYATFELYLQQAQEDIGLCLSGTTTPVTPTGGDNCFLTSGYVNNHSCDCQLTPELGDGDPTPVNSPCKGDEEGEVCNQEKRTE